ncbi:MAG: polyprenyl diphosphate synthase [Gammaproteobacteria bacterium]
MVSQASNNPAPYPRHIAVIMDGNGRWAKANGRPRHAGHRAGVKATREIVQAAAERGIEALTLFAFSSENWNRPAQEVTSLMGLFVEVLQREVDELDRNGIRINFIGARDELSSGLQKKLARAEKQTEKNTQMRLFLAVAYGGRWDLVQSVKSLASRVASGELEAADIKEEDLAAGMSLAEVISPDLLIRTGGEHRVSNFLLWDMAYTELYFTDVLWPDFSAANFDAAIEFFVSRQRRFGKTGEQLEKNTAQVSGK